MKKILISITSVTAIALSSCYYDNEEALYPRIEICDTTAENITYNKAIAPLIKENCLGCHSTANKANGGGLALDSYEAAKGNIDDIYADVKQEQGTNFNPMPKNSQKLSECSIQNLETWATNNFPK